MTFYNSKDFLESAEFPFFVSPYMIKEYEIIPLHSHEFIEFVYIAEGNGFHEYGGSTYPIQQGDVFIISPYAEHAYRVEQNQELRVYNVLFLSKLVAAELETLSKVSSFVEFFYVEPFLRSFVDFQSHLKLSQAEQMEMNVLLERQVKEFVNKEMGYRIMIKNRLIEMFIYLSRCYDRRLHKPMTSQATEAEIIKRVCEFIELHYAQPLSLTQVSQLCGMSQSAFSTKFKQHIGSTFVEYRNDYRIHMAKDALRQTDDKVVSIAQSVGFEDLSFFNKLFKQTTGMSPREYRNQE